MAKKIFIFLGNEDLDTHSGTLADAYERGARAAGHEVRRTNIGDMTFDPLLHKGYKVIQELEPDLKKFQEDVRWCEHFVLVYPNWWGSMPALLKGLFDRVWLPGFAFHFHKDNPTAWDKLLIGRSAHVCIGMNANPFLERLMMGNYMNAIKNGILKFAGFSPIRFTTCGPVERASEERKKAWMEKMEALGRDAA